MPEFSFVNVSHPGEVKAYSTRIRRHVMKDIGKAGRKPRGRNRRRETIIINEEVEVAGLHATTGETVSALDQGDEEDDSRALGRVIGGHRNLAASPSNDTWIGSMVYPFEMSENQLELARYMEDARLIYQPFRFAWLFTGLTDPASWNITLANAALFRGNKLGAKNREFDADELALKYYTRSLESVTRRLVDPRKRDSEGMVVAVAGLVCHDSSVRNFERMQVHMKGLKHMVGNRGGLEKLNNPFLKLMISWLDIEGATSLNISPHFPTLQNSIHEIETVTSTQFLETILTSWDHKCRTLGDIHAALRTTAGVATYINQQTSMATADAGSNFWRDDINMARLLGPAYQEILRLEGKPLPHDITHKDYSTIAAREAFRRAVLLFLAAVKIRWGARAYELPRHLDAFRQIARLPGVQWGAVPEMNLWAHVVAALLEEKDKKEDMMDSLSGEMEVERMWHIETIVGIMGTLGLERGREAVDAARGIVWVEDILGERAGVLEREIDMFLER